MSVAEVNEAIVNLTFFFHDRYGCPNVYLSIAWTR
jgi:hypothetical protein